MKSAGFNDAGAGDAKHPKRLPSSSLAGLVRTLRARTRDRLAPQPNAAATSAAISAATSPAGESPPPHHTHLNPPPTHTSMTPCAYGLIFSKKNTFFFIFIFYEFDPYHFTLLQKRVLADFQKDGINPVCLLLSIIVIKYVYYQFFIIIK
jgi:hypothetical protein